MPVRLICTHCHDTTLWPEENKVQMTVHGVMHVIYDCEYASPVDQAEATLTLENLKAGREEV